MAKIRDIIAYFCKHYPHPAELSKARLTKMVYLADWRSAMSRRKQLTAIRWVFNHYGPYVDDVYEVATSDPIFNVESSINMHGGYKEVISLKKRNYEPEITNSEKEILDHIIKVTACKYWNDFMKLVYSTYPIRNSERYDELDLINFASQYELEKMLS